MPTAAGEGEARPSPARIVLGVLSGALLVATVGVDFPTLSRGKLWSDGATYLAMATSLVQDRDLRYEAKDLVRFEEAYEYGPHGLFLKKAGGVLYFAKSLVYPLVGAPFVSRMTRPRSGCPTPGFVPHT